VRLIEQERRIDPTVPWSWHGVSTGGDSAVFVDDGIHGGQTPAAPPARAVAVRGRRAYPSLATVPLLRSAHGAATWKSMRESFASGAGSSKADPYSSI
jgi:hypothetical protein